MFIKKDTQSQLIEKTEWWIAVKIDGKMNKGFILVFVYLNPNFDIMEYINMLDNLVTDLDTRFPDSKIFLAGDFNARIGDLNSLNEQEEGLIFENLVITAERSTLDISANERGIRLTEFLSSVGFFVINGRSCSDSPAQFTFLGNNSNKSTIDLVWANLKALPEVIDLKVSDTIITSDHLPVCLWLDIFRNRKYGKVNPGRPPLDSKNIKWTAEKKETFMEELKNLESTFPLEAPIEEGNSMLLDSISKSALKAGMTPTKAKIRPENPWFTEECLTLKMQTKAKFKLLKSSQYDSEIQKEYTILRKNYNYAIKNAKKQYFMLLRAKFENLKNASEFWKFLKPSNRKIFQPNPIPVETWLAFFNDFYTEQPTQHVNLEENNDPRLAQPFTKEEVLEIIHRNKPGKAAGPDCIPSDFYKALSDFWIDRMVDLFNRILREERTPTEWSSARLCLIYKKGDRHDPSNYRGISLLNNIVKIFTGVLANRIQLWCDEEDVLVDEQYGFRKKRGCRDAIFVLSSTINMNLRLPGRKVFVIFADLCKAFDTVSHEKLWVKLSNIGISRKIINILSGLYADANFFFMSNGEKSPKVKITKGVLQGDALSPLLFSLYINDLSKYLKEEGLTGVSITGRRDVLAIKYADDTALLASTRGQAQKTLDALKRYCDSNELIINVNKTKIMVFRKGGRLSKAIKFFLQGQAIEIVNEFNYLGVILSTSGLFRAAANNAIRKANLAIANVRRMLANSKLHTWEARMAVFKSIAEATLLYGAEIWAPWHLKELEKVPSNFVKSTFGLLPSTPHYIIRKETGMNPIAPAALRRILKWWENILEQPENSLVQCCLRRLIDLDKSGGMSTELNWVSKVKSIVKPSIQKLGLDEHQMRSENLKILAEQVEEDYKDQYRLDDARRIVDSSYCPLYQYIMESETRENYLNLHLRHDRTKTIMQLRLHNKNWVKLSTGKLNYSWSADRECECCNLKEKETLMHFIFKCPAYNGLRVSLPLTSPSTESRFKELVTNLTTEKVKAVCNFIHNALRIRNFILEE